MCRIMFGEVMVQIILNGLALLGGVVSNSALAMQVAKGYSSKMEHILFPTASKEEKSFGKRLLTISLMCGTMLMLVEMACYITIYIQLYRNDEKMKTSLSKNTVSYRRKRNVISLSTQAIGLGIEMFCSIVGSLIISFQIADATIFFISVSIASATTSLMHVLGSGEMRQYYFAV